MLIWSAAYFEARSVMNVSDIDALYLQGIQLLRSGQPAPAAELFRRALAADYYFVEAYNGLGLALAAMGRTGPALQAYDMAIRIAPEFASPHINRGIVLRGLGQLEAALASVDRAIALQPDNGNAHGNRGSILTELQRPAEAIAAFDKALALNPNQKFLQGIRLINRVYGCDWSTLATEVADIEASIGRGEVPSPPWPLLAFMDKPDLQRRIAETWAATDAPENPGLGPLQKYPAHERIRLGYYSADFHRHATAYLIAELFERHDRAKFELIAFSFGSDVGDDMQQRIAKGCDRFIDVRERSNPEIAAMSREMQIDIAIDLKGLTLENRIGIFAHRAAPVQVSYLGYPGTMGAPYIDYVVADETVIPADAHSYYTEKVVTLPHCYQVSDRKRKVSDRTFTRAELGLPDQGFVFCCFNNNFKILPAVFDVWMRILKAVDGSVLWLIFDNETAVTNLRKEAAARGIDPQRLVFAPRIVPDEHLARHRHADLVLDTLPYNAHTTANDALWMGVPVLTCPGRGFPARVAASLLRVLGLNEMIVPTMADYETLAIALAQDRARLGAIKDEIARARDTSPLFDTDRFTRDLETSYVRMMEIQRAGRAPEAVSIT
ncbi:MAG: O-linked N-acetylglucosamine transferase, SPINDLY family protein [Candidatus Binataceae bacterium]